MRRSLVIHPFLFALWPCAFAFAQSQEHLELAQLWPSALIPLGVTAVLFLLLTLILRDGRRAGIVLSVFLFLMFSFGQFVKLVRIDPVALLVVWAVLFAAGSASAVLTKRGLDLLTQTLNLVASVLVLAALISIGMNVYHWQSAFGQWPGFGPIESASTTPQGGDSPPDIYYIVVDGYARADILEELYGYDNSEFLEYLEQTGFYVADKSRTNYAQTALSLAASLNLDYLDGPAAYIGTDTADRSPLRELIRNSVAIGFLKERGYLTVSYPTGYSLTTLAPADTIADEAWVPNEFETALLGTTPFPWLRAGSEIGPEVSHAYHILNTFDHLAGTAEVDSPHFVFVHIVCPHPPFIFDEDGKRVEWSRPLFLQDGSHFFESGGTPEEYRAGYVRQVQFVNKRLQMVLDDLISRSEQPPIIILQADHGSGLRLDWDEPGNTYFGERLSILNAYLLPGGASDQLYRDITPVNTFRLIFRYYFGADLEPLEDRSYFSTWRRPYDFIDVTTQVQVDQAEP